ncbi:hypothetical protein ABZ896_06955 [Streptomyces sp. NPDC047072]|uniref:hypothetical protein n=1 Tax=Streptomyces sp. NPDC047072 TaxID=3154809 RepID=UPI0033EFA063
MSERPDVRHRGAALARSVRARLRPTGNRVTGYLAVCAVGALVATSLTVGAGASGTRPRLADIGAWLASGAKGEVVHAHGLTGDVDGRITLPSGTTGHPVEIARDGAAPLLLDERTGRVVRLDAAQLTADRSTKYGAAGLQLVSGGAYAYVVDPAKGTVQRIDPARTTPEGPPEKLGGRPGTAVADGEGTLWVPLPDRGTVVPFVAGHRSTAIEVADPGHDLALTLAGDRPVVTDRTAAVAKALAAAGVQGTFDLGDAIAAATPADVLVPARTDGSLVPVLAAGSGDLVLVDVRSRQTLRTRIPVTGLKPGAPQVLGKRVYVPDESSGRLLVYDTSLSASAAPVRVTGGAGALELFVRDGLLWANDPDGADAAVIDAKGAVKHIAKYRTGAPAAREPGAKPVEDSVPTGFPAAPVQPGATVTATATTAPANGTPTDGTSAGPPGPTPGPTPPEREPGAPGAPQAESLAGGIRLTFAEALGATPQRYVLKGAAPDQKVTPEEIDPDGPFVFEVTGGSCEQQYSFTVVAEYGENKPPKESAPSALARPCIAPGAPEQLTFTPAQGGHGGTVSWEPPEGAGGTVTYTINGPGGTAKTAETSHTYEGLRNGTVQGMAVMASNAAGAGSATSGWIDLTPPTQKMHIVHNNNDAGTIGIRTKPTTHEGMRTGSIPGLSSPEVTVYCWTKGSQESDSHTGAVTDVWAYLTYQERAGTYTGYTTDLYVDSRFNPDVWECE